MSYLEKKTQILSILHHKEPRPYRQIHHPPEWKAQGKDSAFMKLDAVKLYEGKWELFET